MGAFDVSAQVRTWALAEVEQQCFGEEFGVDVGWDAVPGATGVQVGYRIAVSCRAPLLGQGPLFSLAPLLTPQPTQEQVRDAVTAMLKQLRELSAQMLKAPARSGT
jgi:hypothetical protein